MGNKVVCIDTSEQLSDEGKKGKRFDVFKLFTQKNLKIVILIILAILGMIVYFGMSSKAETKENGKKVSTSNTYKTTLEYCADLEEKLKSVLSSIKGAGNVSVMITVDGSPELVYAVDSDEKVSSNSSGSTTTSNSSSPIIVNVNGSSSALILTENLPQVKGVMVVSSGARDVSVKLDILNAVSTLLGIPIEKISVLKGN